MIDRDVLLEQLSLLCLNRRLPSVEGAKVRACEMFTDTVSNSAALITGSVDLRHLSAVLVGSRQASAKILQSLISMRCKSSGRACGLVDLGR